MWDSSSESGYAGLISGLMEMCFSLCSFTRKTKNLSSGSLFGRWYQESGIGNRARKGGNANTQVCDWSCPVGDKTPLTTLWNASHNPLSGDHKAGAFVCWPQSLIVDSPEVLTHALAGYVALSQAGPFSFGEGLIADKWRDFCCLR